MRFPRSCGTLVHPTSFPGKYGMGDFGFEARTFIDFLERTDQTIWQVLPLTPTGYGNSPYASYSAFAGNVYLISPDLLHKKGLLEKEEIEAIELPSTTEADYESSFENKDKVFKLASDRFYDQITSKEEKAFNAFKKQNEHWLDDYVLFMACSLHYDKQPWNTWDKDIAQRKPKALKAYRKKFKEQLDFSIGCSTSSTTNGSRLKSMPINEISELSVIFPSLWITTVQMYGQILNILK